jgi:thymidylate synthase (FAD)
MKVTYLDHMGTDLSVVNAARVSFGERSKWENDQDDNSWVDPFIGEVRVEMRHPDFVGKLSDRDRRLIRFLARGCTSGDWDHLVGEITEKGVSQAYDDYAIHPVTEEECDEYDKELRGLLNHIRKMPSHWSPFAHTAISLHLKMPIFVARQIMKHTTGLEYNEVSRRYVDSDPEFYLPDVWRKKADNVKQGSSDEAVDLYWGPEHLYERPLAVYKRMLETGVAPEQARMVLPQSMYTEVIATGNLYAIANMYIQRTDSHAQKETQDLAKQIGEIVKPLYPVSWAALVA